MAIRSGREDYFVRAAQGWSQQKYDEPLDLMKQRAEQIWSWGTPLEPGDRVVELGIGDGLLCCLLASQGLEVVGVDRSPTMVEEARKRAEREGVSAKFVIADANGFEFAEPVDAFIAFMGAFFRDARDPLEMLSRIRPMVRKKVIVDWNESAPYSIDEALELVRRAGYASATWRPHYQLGSGVPAVVRKGLRWIEGRSSFPVFSLLSSGYTLAGGAGFPVLVKGEAAP